MKGSLFVPSQKSTSGIRIDRCEALSQGLDGLHKPLICLDAGTIFKHGGLQLTQIRPRPSIAADYSFCCRRFLSRMRRVAFFCVFKKKSEKM